MHIDELHSRINTAISWNAFSYTVFKLTSTVLTFVLFKQLSTTEFAVWTGINSLVYLILVWADMGMRKTVPTFFPLIKESNRKQYTFLLIGAYTAILTIACPFALWLVSRYAYQVHLPMNNALLFASALLFFGHGLEMLFQTIFHAYLWQRTYNTLLAAIQFAYMVFVIIAAFVFAPSLAMVFYIVLGKGIASLICALLSAVLLNKRLPHSTLPVEPLSPDFLKKFTKHAGLMWGAAVLKSLTERNITVPFVTYFLGPSLGNIFKVAQDGALLLQRLIFRTIGTTDTSLFAYLKSTHNAAENHQVFQHAFTKLATKLAYLAIPLIGVVWFIQCQVSCCGTSSYGFDLFFIISIGLLLELLLTPYERMLEVHADYADLACAYLFYIVTISFVFMAMAYGYIQLISFVIALYTVRLLSMGIMAYAVYRTYHLKYPFKKICILMIIILFFSYILHLGAHYFCGTTLLTILNHFFKT